MKPDIENNNYLWEKEQEIISKLKEKYPEEFIAPKKHDRDLLPHIGIGIESNDLPEGYIKLHPFDFIVEEITKEGEIITADEIEKRENVEDVTGETIFTDMVKIGLSTLDAVKRIAEYLNIDISRVAYAGIKDAGALTAQRISFRKVEKKDVEDINIPKILLKNLRQGKGVVTVGALAGNRFTLFVRTKGRIEENSFVKNLEKIKKEGVFNFYGPQRFGSPRFLSHHFGKLLFQGKPEELVKTILTKDSPFEWPYLAKLREKAKGYYGSWTETKKILDELPYSFRIERTILESLEKDSANYQKALSTMPDQIDFWAKSYASYLINLILSAILKDKIEPPKTIPLIISQEKSVLDFYANFLKKEGVENFIQNLRIFPFIKIAKYTELPTKIYPEIHGYKILNEGVAIYFSLPKAAYATTILMFLFNTTSGVPMPEWVKKDYVDTKEASNLGSLANIKNIFAPHLRGDLGLE